MWILRWKNNLINDTVDGLAQLTSSTVSSVIDSIKAHSIEVTNPEEIEAPPQQDNENANDEQIDTNVNVNDSFSDVSFLESVPSSSDALSTNTDGQMISTTNDNSHFLSQVNAPKTRQFSAANEGDLEHVYDSDGELVPFYDAEDGMDGI